MENCECQLEDSKLYSRGIQKPLTIGWPGVEHNQMLERLKAHMQQRFSSIKPNLRERPQVRHQQNKELLFAKQKERSYSFEVRVTVTSVLGVIHLEFTHSLSGSVSNNTNHNLLYSYVGFWLLHRRINSSSINYHVTFCRAQGRCSINILITLNET